MPKLDYRNKVRESFDKAASSIGSATKVTGNTIAKPYQYISDKLTGVTLPFLSSPELLNWSEKISQGTASIYDKALDMEYLKTHIGGGTHRMFDGGHDIVNAWERVKNATEQDTFSQEVMEYVTALWKDVTTKMGLPVSTLDKANYDGMANWVSHNIPLIDKGYLYDLLSFDIFEVIGSSVGAVAFIFALNKKDQKKLAEILGSMGVTTIASANPVMAIVLIFLAGYAYFIKKHKFEVNALVKGASIATTSVVIFSLLGLPLLVELGIVIVVTMLVRKHIVDNDELHLLIKQRMVILSDNAKQTTKQTAKQFRQNMAYLNDSLIVGIKEESKFFVNWILKAQQIQTEEIE